MKNKKKPVNEMIDSNIANDILHNYCCQ